MTMVFIAAKKIYSDIAPHFLRIHSILFRFSSYFPSSTASQGPSSFTLPTGSSSIFYNGITTSGFGTLECCKQNHLNNQGFNEKEVPILFVFNRWFFICFVTVARVSNDY